MANVALTNELHQLSYDIQNNKITVRLKALKRLDEILNTRSDEVKLVLDTSNDESTVSWNVLFNSAYEGVLKVKQLFLCITMSFKIKQFIFKHIDQISKTTTESLASTREFQKNDHSVVLQKVVASANIDQIRIPFKTLITKCLEILQNPLSKRSFGWSFIQLIEKSVLLSETDLTKVSLTQWNGML